MVSTSTPRTVGLPSLHSDVTVNEPSSLNVVSCVQPPSPLTLKKGQQPPLTSVLKLSWLVLSTEAFDVIVLLIPSTTINAVDKLTEDNVLEALGGNQYRMRRGL